MLKVVAYKRELAETIKKLEKIFEDSEYKKEFDDFEKKYNEVAVREKVCVVVAGEYSTGKSTIISALTGENLEIDSDVKTNQATMYEYEGTNIIDTPGLLAGFEDHTKISKEEIEKADFIIYCITTELFTPSSLKEFIKILDNKNFNNKVILAVNKLGMEAAGGKQERISQIMGYYDGIMNAIEGEGKNFDESLIKIFSASNYIKGKKEKNDAMVRDSYFEDFMEVLDGCTENIKGLNFRCEKQVDMISNFLQYIKDEMNKKDTSEQKEQRQKKREEYKERILKIQEDENRKIKKAFSNKEDELLNYVRMVYDDDKINNSEIKKHIEDGLEKTVKNINEHIKEIYKEIGEEIKNNEELEDYRESSVNVDIEIKRKKQKKYKESKMTKKSEAIQETASQISSLAKPVEIGKKGLFGRKKVFSEIGGEGTKLNAILSKVFGRHSTKISSGVGKIASGIEKHSEALKAGGMAFDIVFCLGRMYSENKEIEERRLGLSKLERSIRELIGKQQKITMDYFSDNIKEILKGINSLGACLSDNKFEREIEKSYIELKNLKEKL